MKHTHNGMNFYVDSIEAQSRAIDLHAYAKTNDADSETCWWWEARACDECGAPESASSEHPFFRHEEHDTADCTACAEDEPCKRAECSRRTVDDDIAEGPMMNYLWPCKWDTFGDGYEVARAVAHLSVIPVEIDGETGFMLTGGGQDLSWEIAEAYVAIGHYPPACLDLPMDCRDLSGPSGERWMGVVEALHHSYEVLASWCKARRERLQGVVKSLRAHTRKRKREIALAAKKAAEVRS